MGTQGAHIFNILSVLIIFKKRGHEMNKNKKSPKKKKKENMTWEALS
jgi:hypothetical protein